eukprot:TRINITY_DN8961_c0_g1_i1.p1 TRINITY_DN8961_c0_g1~~TRINITY_DN8961_c0_g1_i1.p1  ORF type:complete len:121 (+),score=28.79 TRINITY_DN8961_c0_g1_i1:63-425(+)
MDKEALAAASEEASRQIASLVPRDDIHQLNTLQQLILGRLQDSNAVLSHFNEYSEQSFAAISSDFSKNTHLLKSLNGDMVYIFQKLRSMKARMLSHSPDIFKDISDADITTQRPNLEEKA